MRRFRFQNKCRTGEKYLQFECILQEYTRIGDVAITDRIDRHGLSALTGRQRDKEEAHDRTLSCSRYDCRNYVRVSL